MHIAPFAIEEYFALYEFNVPHILCASDCESMTVAQFLALAGEEPAGLTNIHLGYTESAGSLPLRETIATQYPGISAEEVVFLSAPEEGIFVAMHTLLQPGDEVIVLSPAYDSLRNLAAHICGAENVKQWSFRSAGSRWQLSLDDLEALLSPRTKMVIVNFPHNPTGYLPTPAEFTQLLNLVQQHGAWLFCDEMYRGLELHGRETLPSAAGLYERSIVLSGLSKVHGLPGLRAGWLVVRDEAVRGRLINWKHYTTICATALSEYLTGVALAAQGELIRRSRRLIEENLAVAQAFFARWPQHFTWRPQQAGSVALVKLHGESAAAHCRRAIAEAGVLLLPGTYLGYDDHHLRLGTGRATFAENLAVYEAWLEKTQERN